MTVYRKRRSQRKAQRGGEHTTGTVAALASRFGGRVGPSGSRPVRSKPEGPPPVRQSAVQEPVGPPPADQPPEDPLTGHLGVVNRNYQYGPEDSTPNVIPPIEINVGNAVPLQASPNAQQKYETRLQREEQEAQNAYEKSLKREELYKYAPGANTSAANSAMKGLLGEFEGNPNARGPWPSKGGSRRRTRRSKKSRKTRKSRQSRQS